MVVEGPIFRRQKIDFSPTGEMNGFTVAAKKAFMINNTRQLVTVDISQSEEPKSIDIVRSGRIHKKMFKSFMINKK